MKFQIRLAVLLMAAVLCYSGCGYFPSPTTPSLSTSDPLPSEPVPEPIPKAIISIADVILETNNQRKANGLSSLSENEKLNAAADFKMRDMFARQYFDHYGPGQISGIPELLMRFGYNYIVAGENLALGDFGNANDLVSVWMASPGHRVNILNSAYRDIGVATGYDLFQGRQTIIVVQIFGTSVR